MREQDEDAAWRAIVDNYGERATLNDPPAEVETEPEAVLPEQAEDQTQPESIADRPDDPPYSAILDAPEENFVPPPAPPLPSPRGPVGMAWLGLLGSPALLLIFVLTGTSVPWLISWGLVAAFLGGFFYLVWHLPREPRDPYDDGARI